MANKARDLLIVGLRNAHAMERQAQELMERQSERTRDYPQVQQRLSQHLQETRAQLQRLEAALRSLGESESALKDTAMSLTGNLAAMAHSLAGDEILKNMFANDAFEHYEIAAYKSLLTLCDAAGVNLRADLQKSLDEEEQMAAWIDSHLRDVTLQFVAHEERAAA
jgi:ferritin-like metal-binding protein YciE